jgi:hypothetical protein
MSHWKALLSAIKTIWTFIKRAWVFVDSLGTQEKQSLADYQSNMLTLAEGAQRQLNYSPSPLGELVASLFVVP